MLPPSVVRELSSFAGNGVLAKLFSATVAAPSHGRMLPTRSCEKVPQPVSFAMAATSSLTASTLLRKFAVSSADSGS